MEKNSWEPGSSPEEGPSTAPRIRTRLPPSTTTSPNPTPSSQLLTAQLVTELPPGLCPYTMTAQERFHLMPLITASGITSGFRLALGVREAARPLPATRGKLTGQAAPLSASPPGAFNGVTALPAGPSASARPGSSGFSPHPQPGAGRPGLRQRPGVGVTREGRRWGSR